MRHHVTRWIINAYANGYLADDGRIVRGDTPWTVRGRLTQTDKDRARDWIKYAGNTTGHWLVRYDDKRRAWYVNTSAYPTSGAMLSALDQVVPPQLG
jgi:hypothetical protein